MSHPPTLISRIPFDVRRLSAPLSVLQELAGLVIIDEVQRQPDLFALLRVLVDRPQNPARFLLLGSASPHLVKGVSESLSGRIGFIDLSGFDLAEEGACPPCAGEARISPSAQLSALTVVARTVHLFSSSGTTRLSTPTTRR